MRCGRLEVSSLGEEHEARNLLVLRMNPDPLKRMLICKQVELDCAWISESPLILSKKEIHIHFRVLQE